MSINYGLGEKGCVFLLLLAKLHFEIFMGFQPSFSPLFSLFRQAAEANIPCSEKACDPLICFQNINPLGLPWWLRWYSICLQRGRLRFDSWVGKIPWRRKWQPHSSILARRIPWTEKSGRLHTGHGVAKCRTRLSN